METGKLSKEQSDKIAFISYIIPKFADEYKMDTREAYLYLKRYGALDFMMEHWWALHIDNPFWAVRHLYDICYENGGMR